MITGIPDVAMITGIPDVAMITGIPDVAMITGIPDVAVTIDGTELTSTGEKIRAILKELNPSIEDDNYTFKIFNQFTSSDDV